MYASKQGIISMRGARWNLFQISRDLVLAGITLKQTLRLVVGDGEP